MGMDVVAGLHTNSGSISDVRQAAKKDDNLKTNGKLSAEEIQQIKDQVEMSTESLRRLVGDLITNQGKTSSGTYGLNISIIIGAADGTSIHNSDDAKSAISKDGIFGVDAVSDRIVNFAKAVSGNDKSKLAELKDAIDKGFGQAKKALGGELPDICNQTYDAVMDKLDDWSSEE